MELKTGSNISSAIASLFGWIWIISIIAIPILILWAILGSGRWYYPLIAIAFGGFCKALCREYLKTSEEMFYESTEKDYALEWIDLPENDKKEAVVEAFKATVAKYHPDAEVDSWVSKWEDANRFDDIVKEITEGYRDTGLKKPFQVVCHTFLDNYFLSLVSAK